MDHTVVHFEIPADDPERAARFYRELFGWEIKKFGAEEGEKDGRAEAGEREASDATPGPAEYWMIMTVPAGEEGKPTRAGVNGGLMRRQHAGQTPVNYIGVGSVDDHAARALELGAEIVLRKTPVQGMGWFAWVRDPDGNVLGLWESDERAA